MIIISLLKSLLFLAGWDGAIGPLLPATAFSLKGLVFCFLFVLVRATFPRYRYDQLINIGWKIFLPVATGFLILVVGNLFAFDGLPVLQELNLANYSE
jgi:NADH-quinone oxidoreductase subunit H